MSARVEAAVRELADALREELRAELAGQPEELLAVSAAARRLGVGRSLAYQEIAAGRLRSLLIGRRRLVPSGALADYVAAQSPPGATQ